MELGPDGIVELARGYQKAQVLFVAWSSGVLRAVADRPAGADEVASELGLGVRPVRALLDASAALGLLRCEEGRYSPTRSTRFFLLRSGFQSLAPIVDYWGSFGYERWARLASVVEGTTQGGDETDIFARPGAELESFTRSMAASSRWTAARLVEAVDLGDRRHLVDVGAGEGVFTSALLERNPSLRATLVDLAPVLEQAATLLTPLVTAGRVALVEGDYLGRELPNDGDCLLLSNVLHDRSPAEARGLISRCREALGPGGRLLVVDYLPESPGESLDAALLGVSLLLETAEGCLHSREEVEGWILEAGFSMVESHVLRHEVGIHVLVAEVPGADVPGVEIQGADVLPAGS